MRSSILREDLPLYVEGKRQRESSRLDSIPNDLSEVVNKVLTYIELNHEESNIRERYIRNFELARRRPFGDIDHYIPENGDESAETVSLNGVNGHSLKLNGHQLSFDDMVSDLSASNTNLRLETEYQENVSVVNGVNNSSYQNPQTSEAFGGYSLKWGDEQTKIDTNDIGSTSLSPFDSIRAKYREEYTTGKEYKTGKEVIGLKTQGLGEIAIYHALKNDFQSGGHVEEVRALNSKSDPIPFANVENVLAEQTATEYKIDSPQNESIQALDLKGHFDDRSTLEPVSPVDSDHLTLTDELESFALDETFGLNVDSTKFDSIVDSVKHVESFSFNGLRNDFSHSMEYERGNVHQPNHLNGHKNSPHMTNGYNGETFSENCGVEVDVDSGQKTVSDSLFASNHLEARELTSWFHSDFLENDSDCVMSAPNSMLTEGEQSRTESLFEAVVLLRTLTEDHWTCFDLGDTYTMFSEDPVENASADPEPNHLDTRRTVDILSDLFSSDTLHSEEQLTTADFNFSLARIAVATDIAPDDILALLMQTHKQMNELTIAGFPESRPNSITHEILLLALVRRFSAFQNAIDLVTALSKSPNFAWTPNSLLVASELCKRKDSLKMSRDIMNDLRNWNASKFIIPKRVFQNLITVYKDNDARKDAVEMLRLGLKQASGKSDRFLDDIFVNAIKWPTKSRLSRFIDNSSVIADILLLLENDTVYVAGLPVWKELIKRSALGAAKIPSRWEFVAKSFLHLSVAAPYYWPDHHLLQQGLEASGVLGMPSLACDLLRRAIVNYIPSPLQMMENPMHRRPYVPYQHFVNGISSCVKANDMKACEKILHIAKCSTMNPANLRSLYILALKGYAHLGDVDNSVKLLETMIAEKLIPGEDCYGALFYAYAMSNQLDAARVLLQDMESGVIGVLPGPTCYDGFIMACARHLAWDDILAAFETMKILNVSISSSSSHGIVLAAAKMGGRSEVKGYVESMVASNAKLYGDGALLALRILLDGLIVRNDGDDDELPLDAIRERLRVLIQQNPLLQSECLRLIRSLRMAESEESRYSECGSVKNQSFLPLTDSSKRRHDAWQAMLNDLLTLVNTAEPATEPSQVETSHSSSLTLSNDDCDDEQLVCK